jgi:hypothetical protein
MYVYDVLLDGADYRVNAANVNGALDEAIRKAIEERVVFDITTITTVEISRVGFAS